MWGEENEVDRDELYSEWLVTWIPEPWAPVRVGPQLLVSISAD
jgi:hypothetical protein